VLMARLFCLQVEFPRNRVGLASRRNRSHDFYQHPQGFGNLLNTQPHLQQTSFKFCYESGRSQPSVAGQE
ncbi:MAG TPA: hypothetical protein V6C65_33330, partial [Allocoleopsis sp.]